MGSRFSGVGPPPLVLSTSPPAPAPPPPAPLVVPPGPPPPVTVVPEPPSVFVTRPVETPRSVAPAFARRYVRVRNVQVDARNRDVVVVLQRQRNRIRQAQINLPVPQQRVEPRRVCQPRQRHVGRRVRLQIGFQNVGLRLRVVDARVAQIQRLGQLRRRRRRQILASSSVTVATAGAVGLTLRVGVGAAAAAPVPVACSHSSTATRCSLPPAYLLISRCALQLFVLLTASTQSLYVTGTVAVPASFHSPGRRLNAQLSAPDAGIASI